MAEEKAQQEVATFAGGCFWCMEPPFDSTTGVLNTVVGYIGGHKDNPTYKEVSSGGTGHTEAIQITFDPKVVSYDKLLEIFWRNHDPLDAHGQFCDKGNQYRAGVFYHSDAQRAAAESSKKKLIDTKTISGEIATEITKASTFYPAEDYHQDYYKRNPIRYKFYRYNCGRDSRLEKLWGEKR